MNISELCDHLLENCGFIHVDSHPTGDDYGAMTIVQLTGEQLHIWNQLDKSEIKRRIAASENYVRAGLMQPYFLKSPEVKWDGAGTIYFHGSKLVAAVFLVISFLKENFDSMRINMMACCICLLPDMGKQSERT